MTTGYRLSSRTGSDEIQAMLRDGCSELKIEVTDEGLGRLESYFHELKHWSRRMNLIGKSQDSEDIIANHFLDSLLLLPQLREKQSTLVDVGSGAGFPGLVCKAAEPELSLKLVEPRLKRVSFLRHLIRRLQLTDVSVMPKRIEDVEPNILECSHFVSRAVADIADFLCMLEGLSGMAAEIVCMKGPKWEEELAFAGPVIDRMQLRLIRRENFFLPYSGKQRVLLSFARK